MGLSFESLIGYETDGRRYPLVATAYLHTVMGIGNERFVENTKRIERFRAAFRDSLAPTVRMNPEGREWEDSAARRERLRVEGLRRKALRAEALALEQDPNRDEDEDGLYGGFQ
jgi:tRNA wybutosine-synthesizing protein 3